MKSLLQTTMNTRDLGGHPTVDGKVTLCDQIYRSDAALYPNEEDIHFLQQKGVTTIIDFRTEPYVTDSPDGFSKLPGFTYHNIPIPEGSNVPESVEAVPGSYLEIALSKNSRRVFETMADAENGVLFHCSAGKDRSGVVTAILLLLCDVPENEIVSDYMVTKECNRERFKNVAINHPGVDINIVIPRESYMSDFLELFRDRFGDVRGYFSEIGVPDETVERLRAKLRGAE